MSSSYKYHGDNESPFCCLFWMIPACESRDNKATVATDVRVSFHTAGVV